MDLFVKYTWLLLISIFCFGNISKAQDLDSLERVSRSKAHDTSRLRALILLGEKSVAQNILKYAEPALKLAEHNLAKPGVPASLRKVYLKGSADALSSIAYYHEQYADHSKSLQLNERALKIYEQLKDSLGMANTLLGIGNAQSTLKGGRSALSYYEKALSICEKIRDSLILANLLNNIGAVYSTEARTADALDYMHKSLKVCKAKKDSDGVVRQLAAISLVYLKQGDYEKAQRYNFEALKLHEETGAIDQFKTAQLLHNIAHVYVSAKDWEKAEPYFSRSLAISQKLNHSYGISYCYTGLAKIYQQQGHIDKAHDYFNRALKINEEIGDKLGTCVSLHSLSTFYAKTGRLSKASEYGEKALVVATELNSISKIGICAKILYMIYKKQNNPAKALKMYELFIVNRDSVHSEEARRALVAAQLQYDFDKKEALLKAEKDKAILLFEKKQAVLEAGSERKKLLVIIGFTGTGLITVLLLLIIYRNRSRKKQKQIEFEKSVLELEQQALRAQMNPHFIFNAINSIQSYILKREKQDAYDYLAKFSRLIRLVLNNSQEKDLLLHQELEMIELYVELEQLRFNNFKFNLDISERVNQFEIVVPSMLIQPYVENAIVHGLMNLENERKGILNVSITQSEGILKISIEDNGVGRDRARQYKRADAHKSLGMAFTEQRLNVINRMQQYEKAKVVITDLYNSNKESTGTKVEIFIPVDGK